MKQRILLSIIITAGLIFGGYKKTDAQIGHILDIDSIVSRVTIESIRKTVRELSGDTSCIIGGNPYTILTRAWNYPGNNMAAQYIIEKFRSFGMKSYYWKFSATGTNVIGRKPGIKYPHKIYILCAHYDSYPWEAFSPGADDDASGVACVIEAAKLLSTYKTDCTILFMALDEEERGLYGSRAYADSAYVHGDTIMGVINTDMLGWDQNNNNKIVVYTDTNSYPLANIVYSSIQRYVPGINSFVRYTSGSGGSDESSFRARGYMAVLPWEDPGNPFINSLADSIERFNFQYFRRTVQSVISSIAVLGFDYVIYFKHQPLVNTLDTSDRIASVTIRSNHPLAITGSNAPRLYYKVNSGIYQYVNYSYHNLDTFKFIIPGQHAGVKVSYYFAAQDSAGVLFATYPGGGKGINPPGTIPPNESFTYLIPASAVFCSNNVPVSLTPKQWTYASMYIPLDYTILDLDVKLTIYHPNDQDLLIAFVNNQNPQIKLSFANGGNGANYINTVFDDEATDSIKYGVPPFTGSFVPVDPLRICDNKTLQGTWKMRIYNNSESITGQLTSWCLNVSYVDLIGIRNNQVPVRSVLSQNYPNPFNPVTTIKYSIPKQSLVRLVVYDMLGREVTTLINEVKQAGDYSVTFDASGYASGVYFYRIEAGEFTDAKKMVLIK